MKWLKFYGQDWLTDLKIRSMSVEDRLCFITLLCLASGADEDGLIRHCTEESVIGLTNLHDGEVGRARGCLERYEALQIVTLARNGDVTVCNFGRRQGQNLSNAERQKKYRERRKTTTKPRNERNVTQRNDSNARIEQNRIDKKDTHTAEPSSAIPQIIKLFEEINPNASEWYSNTTQRKAVASLIERVGFEKLERVVKALPSITAQKAAPRISTPFELKRDWAKLGMFINQQKSHKEILL